VPVGPHLDELAGGLDCEHVLTRSVRDSALMLDLTAGPEPTSRGPLTVPPSGFSAALNAAVPPLRIGMTLAAPGGIRPNPEIAAAVESVAKLLARAGHEVNEFTFPESANIGEPALVIWLTAIAEEIDYYRRRVGRSPEPHELEALTWAGIDMGRRSSALDYVRARRALTAATRDMAEVFTRFDVLILPTTAEVSVRIGQIDGRTAAFTVTGQPAVSLPLGVSTSGMPIGVQMAAPLGKDARLLSIAAWLEREAPWAPRLASLRSRYAFE